MKKSKFFIVNGIIIGVLVAIFLAVNIAVGVLFKDLTRVFEGTGFVVKQTPEADKAREEGEKVAEKIVEEGIVLLRNENNVLPLASNEKLNLFGWATVSHIRGGDGGSGGATSKGVVTIEDAMKNAGFTVNENLLEMYRNFEGKRGDVKDADDGKYGGYGKSWGLPEPSVADETKYTPELKSSSEEFSDVAVVTIARGSGECVDIPEGYLSLTQTEKDMLSYVRDNYGKMIVVVNSNSVMELGYLKEIDVDAILFMPGTGAKGANALGKILCGTVNPSGKLADTMPYNHKEIPSYYYANRPGSFEYSDKTEAKYVDYVEGIYVGYKYWETAFEEKTIDYGKSVQYPFGFGLSYTSFDWTISEVRVNGSAVTGTPEITEKSQIEVDVKVTNTGDRTGKDVVEAYVTAPYTDGGIEKAHVNLVGFAKTDSIEPGEEDTVTVKVDAYDFASYDAYDRNNNGFAGYELENGAYDLKLMTDAHNVKMSEETPLTVEFGVSETIKIDKDPVTEAKVGNLFTGENAVDGTPLDGGDGAVSYMSRASFEHPSSFEKSAPRAASQAMLDRALFNQAWADSWDNADTDVFGDPVKKDAVRWGANNGLAVANNSTVTELGYKLGADFDAPEWDSLLDQLTTAECLSVFNKSYGIPEVKSIGMPRRPEYDGPSQVKGFIMGKDVDRSTGYPCSIVLAQGWNEELAYKHAMSYGQEMKTLGVNGVWASGVNIHRSPYSGRNFEYYSEDAFLSARMVVNFCKGLANRGRYCYLKHFVVNDQETNRSTVSTFCTEQALREIYLKPFRAAVVEGGAMGLMTTYGRIGSISTTSSEALLNGVLRREWKFKGSVITDYTDNAGMSIDAQLRMGGNLGMGVSVNTNGVSTDYHNAPARVQYRMREAMKEVIYTWLHVQYVEQQYLLDPDEFATSGAIGSYDSWNWWQPFVICVDVVDAIAMSVWIFFIFIGKDKSETPAEDSAQTA